MDADTFLVKILFGLVLLVVFLVVLAYLVMRFSPLLPFLVHVPM